MTRQKIRMIGLSILGCLLLTACGRIDIKSTSIPPNLDPVDTPTSDGVVHGRAIYTVNSEQESSLAKLFHRLLIPSAYAASSGTSTVTYTNAASTNFSINVSSFGANGFNGNILSLGSVSLSTISDNNLKVCGAGGTVKCTSAAIRVYTTGSTTGFVQTDDNYGAPIFTGTLNPTTPVGLLAAGSVTVQTLSIPNNKHTVSLSDFPSPSYNVTADFSNAGAGPYSMTYVVEYVLF